MDIRLIASDVDGTILPRGGKISDRTRAAVAACTEQGVPFVVSSGRWYVTAKPIAEELGLTEGYMIVTGGGAVVDMTGRPLQEWTLTREQAEAAYEILKKYDVMRNAFVRDAVYRVNTRALNRPVKGLMGYLGSYYHVVHDDVEIYETKGLNNPYKLEAYGEDLSALADLRDELIEAGYSVSSAYADNLEIMAPGHGKGTAVKWLAGHLGLNMDQCMAFGDGTNDLSLLQAVGWPVAVQNAVEPLKAAARIIAPPCEEDGVAQIIEKALRGTL